MSDGIFAYVREESGRVGIIDYIRRIAMMSEGNKTYTELEMVTYSGLWRLRLMIT